MRLHDAPSPGKAIILVFDGASAGRNRGPVGNIHWGQYNMRM